MKQQKKENRPLYVRVVCWILIILLLASAIYYTIWGLESIVSSFLDDGEETKKSASLPSSAVLLECDTARAPDFTV